MLKKIFYGIVFGILGLIIISFIFGKVQQQFYLSQVERVNVIHLNGTIEESTSDYLQNINPRLVSQKLKRAANDDTIKGVVLRVNSPGGSVAASQEIADMIRDFEKPLVVSMGDMAASGGYYISTPADRIIAHPGTMTGSIGVIMETINTEKLEKKIGIKRETIKSGKHKDLFQGELSQKERQILQEVTDEAYQQFVKEIVRSRDLKKEKVKELATGQIYTGSQALENGLVDKLGGIDDAINTISKIAGLKNPKRYEYPSPGLFDTLKGGLSNMVTVLMGNTVSNKFLYWKKILLDNSLRLRYEIR